MATYGKASHFFRVMLPQMIQNGTLELPRNFVKEHVKHLPMFAHLRVPTGSESKMELKRCEGRAWFDKGWREFVQKYSIRCAYFLVFEYEGGSRFSVRIFDLSTLEIDYPTSCTRTINTKAVECQVTDVKEEDGHDDDDDNISDEYRSGIRKGSVRENATHSRAASARGRVLERVKAFGSPNPHFILTMQPTYVCGRFSVPIPASAGRSYFRKKENNNMNLEGANGRVWSLKYRIEGPPQSRVKISSGWKEFLQGNHLKEGDVCLFELVNSRAMTFKVAIFRVTDEQAAKNEMVDTASPYGARTSTREETKKGRANKGVLRDAIKREAYPVASNAKVLKRPGSFMIYMSRYYIARSSKLHIPIAHFRRYLRNDKHGENIIILHGSNGKTWPVKYRISTNKSIGASFTHGWKDFASDNHLRVGDICIFEMIIGMTKRYKVTISRVADRA